MVSISSCRVRSRHFQAEANQPRQHPIKRVFFGSIIPDARANFSSLRIVSSQRLSKLLLVDIHIGSQLPLLNVLRQKLQHFARSLILIFQDSSCCFVIVCVKNEFRFVEFFGYFKSQNCGDWQMSTMSTVEGSMDVFFCESTAQLGIVQAIASGKLRCLVFWGNFGPTSGCSGIC